MGNKESDIRIKRGNKRKRYAVRGEKREIENRKKYDTEREIHSKREKSEL